MRAYSESNEEALHARKHLKSWLDDGFLSPEQYQLLEEETPSDLCTTNIYLRLVLFFFTLIVVAAAVGLFFAIAAGHPSSTTVGILLLIFGVLAYIAAEVAATQAHLYRHGLEEALAVASVALLCAALGSIVFANGMHSAPSSQCLIAAAGMVGSLWLWYRFGLWYAFPAAMIFAVFLPAYGPFSHAGQRVFLCILYAAGLVLLTPLRARHRFDYLAQTYSLAEAFLWLGICLALNLKLSALGELPGGWVNTPSASDFTAPFYWTTWALLWCLPPLLLARGIRHKNRFVLAVGILTSVLTLATNKPYLGMHRHTWDPMLLGIALIAAAVYLRRWLSQGPGGVRHGLTAAPLSAKDKRTLNVTSSAFGLLQPHAITPAPQPQTPNFKSGLGGGSDGAGASGDF